MYNAKERRKPTLLADVEIQQFNLLANRLQDESEKLDADQSRGRMARLNCNKLEVTT
jgi:hypothetical protein